jgi:putative spermidine/putrescine transport system permease protein
MKRFPLWSWIWIILGALYFLLPLYGTLDFSLRKLRDTLSFDAYRSAFSDPEFLRTFIFSNEMALITIIVSLLLVVPTAYWVHLRLPRLRQVVEFITLLPFVIPAIILVFGLLKTYSAPWRVFGIVVLPSLTGSGLSSTGLLVAGYVVLSLPYMYRAVDNGLRAMDVRTLTEAAQSLGAGWPRLMFSVIFPNLRTALLSGALLTFAIVVGELTLAQFLARPAFGPYLWLLGQHKAYEPAALTIVSFLLTWTAMGVIDLLTRGGPRVVTVAH